MKCGTTSCFAVCLLMLGVIGAAAENTSTLSFPNGSVQGGFKNEAGVVVTQVTVNQQQSTGCDQVSKEHDANISEDSGFYVEYNPVCDYEFHIQVDACPNKEQHVSASDIQSGQVEVILKGTCADLRTSREVP